MFLMYLYTAPLAELALTVVKLLLLLLSGGCIKITWDQAQFEQFSYIL